MLKTTNDHKKFWAERKIDWDKSYLTGVDEVSGQPMWNHPHRELLMQALNSFHWFSLWEVGMGGGANLMKILKTFKQRQLGGSDVNPDAVEFAVKTFQGGMFRTESVEDMLMSDKAVDVMLSDATLIYISPGKIKNTIKEMVRVTRTAILLCELHGGTWWERPLFRLRTGYNAYDYRKLLEDAGCYDLQIIKIPEAYWPGMPWSKWGHVILAKVSR